MQGLRNVSKIRFCNGKKWVHTPQQGPAGTLDCSDPKASLTFIERVINHSVRVTLMQRDLSQNLPQLRTQLVLIFFSEIELG